MCREDSSPAAIIFLKFKEFVRSSGVGEGGFRQAVATSPSHDVVDPPGSAKQGGHLQIILRQTGGEDDGHNRGGGSKPFAESVRL